MSTLACLGFEIAARDPRKLARFYCEALGFEPVGEDTDGAFELRLGACGLRLRPAPRGRAMPADSSSHDRWFRHLAIVVRDMARAWAHVEAYEARLISESPQILPAWNPDAGGIEAVYFRDPEHHPLELIRFPPGKGRAQWHAPGATLFQGVDHSAIVVADTSASLAFYGRLAGLAKAAQAHNHGIEQVRLSGVAGTDVLATTLGPVQPAPPAADPAPGLELLEYLQPRDGRAMPADTRADDAWWSATLFRRTATDAARPASASARTEHVDPDGYRVVIL